MSKILTKIEELIEEIIDKLIKSDVSLQLEIGYRIESRMHNRKRVKFLNSRSCLNFSMYIKLLTIIYGLVEQDICSTKRDLYYQYKDVFKTQEALNRIIDDISQSLLQVTRKQLNILSTSKGLVAGYLQLKDSFDNKFNCLKTTNGHLIQDDDYKYSLLDKTQIKFILIVEKDATFQRLLNDNFLLKYKAILITGKGMPDLSTRKLIHELSVLFDCVPIYCLVDANPFGLQIYTIYKYGSFSLKNEHSQIDRLKLIGLSIKDCLNLFKNERKFDAYEVLSDADRVKAKCLLTREYIKSEDCLREELELMLENNIKYEIQALQSIKHNFLCDVYLKMKLSSI